MRNLSTTTGNWSTHTNVIIMIIDNELFHATYIPFKQYIGKIVT